MMITTVPVEITLETVMKFIRGNISEIELKIIRDTAQDELDKLERMKVFEQEAESFWHNL